MIIDAYDKKISNICDLVHNKCIVCGASNPRGLHLKFEVAGDGSVKADFQCDGSFEGYSGSLHGGVIMSIFDGAMGHCMFARGQTAVTVEMTTRFRQPILTGRDATVSAHITRVSHPLYLLKAEIIQDGRVKATADGKFYDQPKLADETEQFNER
ncbi:MAG: PaaI family thioesterase [Sedimentisphaerales bacterium]|nr:PaaI family thioesterase [Sedimentisphaerales bacterium]